jgi:hypothetical protein
MEMEFQAQKGNRRKGTYQVKRSWGNKIERRTPWA